MSASSSCTRTRCFLNFSFEIFPKKFVGWRRDLTREGVEPNPGPGWKEFEEEALKAFGDDSKTVLDGLKSAIKKKIISTFHVREFLNDSTKDAIRKELDIDDTIRTDLIRILDRLEGISNCLFFQTYFHSSTSTSV